MILVVNGIIFYVGWFACVLGAVGGYSWLSWALVAPAIALHVWWTQNPRELVLIGKVVLAGGLIETTYLYFGMISYASPNFFPIAPWWMLALYALFATSLNGSLKWLNYSPALASLLGGVGGVLSYVWGEKLGAVVYLWPHWLVWSVFFVVWGALTPLCLRWAQETRPQD